MRRPEFLLLTLASVAALVSCFVEAPWSQWLFAGAIAVLPSALIAAGARRHAGPDGRSGGGLGRQTWIILTLPLFLGTSLAGLLAVRGTAGENWWLGLPTGAALLVYGLFALPLLVTTLGYAWSFDRWGLDGHDLDLLRRRFGAREATDEDPRDHEP